VPKRSDTSRRQIDSMTTPAPTPGPTTPAPARRPDWQRLLVQCLAGEGLREAIGERVAASRGLTPVPDPLQAELSSPEAWRPGWRRTLVTYLNSEELRRLVSESLAARVSDRLRGHPDIMAAITGLTTDILEGAKAEIGRRVILRGKLGPVREPEPVYATPEEKELADAEAAARKRLLDAYWLWLEGMQDPNERFILALDHSIEAPIKQPRVMLAAYRRGLLTTRDLKDRAISAARRAWLKAHRPRRAAKSGISDDYAADAYARRY